MRYALTSRRELLKSTTALIAAGLLGDVRDVFAQGGRFKIGACDWSIGMRGKVGAMSLARELGLDGAQISMGSVETDLHLRQPEMQSAYRHAAEASGVRVGGRRARRDEPGPVQVRSAHGTVGQRQHRRRARVERPRRPARLLRPGRLRNDAEGQAEVVRRLKRVARKAEDSGVVLGIESWLSAGDHLRILDAVGSRNVQVYYDVANSTQMGYDVVAEIRQLRADGFASSTPRKTASFSDRAASTSRRCARRWTTSTSRAGSRSKARCPRGSRCSRATSRTSNSCALTSDSRRASRTGPT